MTVSDLFLLFFAVGTLWTLLTWLLGGLHVGHAHGHHAHAAHTAHGGIGHWLACMVNPSSLAVFCAWFGGVGYLLTRHSGLELWTDLALSALFGLLGAWLVAAFLRFLQDREQPLDPADYQMVGVLGRVSCTIRPDGIGELIYVRDGARQPVPARSEENNLIPLGSEAIVTRFEKGVAYVRTWDAMLTQPDSSSIPETLQKKGSPHVE